MATENTIASAVNLTRISQLVLDALQTEGLPLSAFFTDFSGEFEGQGETVTARVPTLPTSQNLQTDRTSKGSALTPIPVTLNNYRGVRIGFTDLERTFTNVKLGQEFIQPAIAVLVEYVMTEALKLATDANGYTNDEVLTASQFDADALADLAEAMTTAKIPRTGRTALVKPTYYATLVKDGAVQNAAASGSTDPLREHRVPRVAGFDVYEYNGTIPANSKNLEGLALHPQAILLAARAVAAPPEGTWYGRIEHVVDPRSGLPIQIREFYDGSELVYEISVLFGAAKGIPAKAVCIVSA